MVNHTETLNGWLAEWERLRQQSDRIRAEIAALHRPRKRRNPFTHTRR